MSNPLRHVGQTARPEDAATPPSAEPAEAGANAAKPPADGSGSTLEQHPRTTDAAPPVKPAGPGRGQNEIDDLEPGEPPPESSAGS